MWRCGGGAGCAAWEPRELSRVACGHIIQWASVLLGLDAGSASAGDTEAAAAAAAAAAGNTSVHAPRVISGGSAGGRSSGAPLIGGTAVQVGGVVLDDAAAAAAASTRQNWPLGLLISEQICNRRRGMSVGVCACVCMVALQDRAHLQFRSTGAA